MEVTAANQPLVSSFCEKGALDSSGRMLALVSGDDLVAGQNPDRNPEVFLYLTREERYLQLTHSKSPTLHSSALLSGDGRVAFFSRADYGLYSLWRCRLPTMDCRPQPSQGLKGIQAIRTTSEGELTLISAFKAPGESRYYLIDGDGEASDLPCDQPPDMDAAGNVACRVGGNVLLLRQGLSSTVFPTPETEEAGLVEVLHPTISSDGTVLVFAARTSITSRGSDLFRLGLTNGRLERITRSGSLRVYQPAVSGDGRWVAFYAGDGLLGESAIRTLRRRGNTLYIYDSRSGKTDAGPIRGCDFLRPLSLSTHGTHLAFSNNCLRGFGSEVHLLLREE